MGIDKTMMQSKQNTTDQICTKPISICSILCNVSDKKLRKVKPSEQETDAPHYPFAKLGLDLSGPYPKTLSGNKYIIGLVDWYSRWPEAFADYDKTAETVVHLL